MTRKRWRVHVLEPGLEPLGERLGAFSTSREARRFADSMAMDYHYGVAIVDRDSGLIDSGSGFEPESPPMSND